MIMENLLDLDQRGCVAEHVVERERESLKLEILFGYNFSSLGAARD